MKRSIMAPTTLPPGRAEQSVAETIDTHGRLPGIDILRCIAAVAVLLSHATNATTIERTEWIAAHDQTPWLFEQVVRVPPGAWGVGLFFVLSGFCIHLPLARAIQKGGEPRLDLPRYFARRFTRIYPPHLAALLLSILAAFFVPSNFFTEDIISVPTRWQLFAHLTMIHSFFANARFSINPVLWTIAVETHFYLCYPLLVLMRRRMGFVPIVVILLAISIGSKAIVQVVHPSYAYLWGQNFVVRFWEWALGCLAAERLVERSSAPRSSWLWFAILLLGSYALAPLSALFPHGAGALARVLPPVFALVLYVGARLPPLHSALYRFGLATGLRSYSLYLTHPIALPLACVFLASLGAPLWAQWIASVVASGLLCAVFFAFVERPFLERSARLRSQQPQLG